MAKHPQKIDKKKAAAAVATKTIAAKKIFSIASNINTPHTTSFFMCAT